MNVFVTLFFLPVLMLASSNTATAASAGNSSTANAATTSTAVVKAPAPPRTPDYHIDLSISKSQSLVDFQDGSRSEAIDYMAKPSVKMSFGTVSATLAYSQDLRDQYSKTASDWNDIPVVLSLKPTKLSSTSRITYSLTAVIPNSQLSTKKDQLQTSLSGRIGYAIAPEGGEGFSFGVGISAGQNFHAFSTDINGTVLNKYSSNQSVSLGYAMGDWSVAFDYIGKSRWTYANSTKSSFEHSEELGYAVTDHFSLALGHTNAGSTLKANGTDSNIELLNENTSLIYGSMGLSY